MTKYEAGTRVVAVRAEKPGRVIEIYGVGTYVGDENPANVPPGDRPHGDWDLTAQYASDFRNPRITLDTGETIWGMEC